MGKPEAFVENYLRDKCKKAGFLCYKFTSPGTSGVPDRVICYQDGVCFVECKRPGGRPTELQVKRINDIRALGIDACIIDNRDKVNDWIAYLQGETERPSWYNDPMKPRKTQRR